jgi:hypothetical protein
MSTIDLLEVSRNLARRRADVPRAPHRLGEVLAELDSLYCLTSDPEPVVRRREACVAAVVDVGRIPTWEVLVACS